MKSTILNQKYLNENESNLLKSGVAQRHSHLDVIAKPCMEEDWASNCSNWSLNGCFILSYVKHEAEKKYSFCVVCWLLARLLCLLISFSIAQSSPMLLSIQLLYHWPRFSLLSFPHYLCIFLKLHRRIVALKQGTVFSVIQNVQSFEKLTVLERGLPILSLWTGSPWILYMRAVSFHCEKYSKAQFGSTIGSGSAYISEPKYVKVTKSFWQSSDFETFSHLEKFILQRVAPQCVLKFLHLNIEQASSIFSKF